MNYSYQWWTFRKNLPPFDNLYERLNKHLSLYIAVDFCVLLVIRHYFGVSGHEPRKPPIVKPSIYLSLVII